MKLPWSKIAIGLFFAIAGGVGLMAPSPPPAPPKIGVPIDHIVWVCAYGSYTNCAQADNNGGLQISGSLGGGGGTPAPGTTSGPIAVTQSGPWVIGQTGTWNVNVTGGQIASVATIGLSVLPAPIILTPTSATTCTSLETGVTALYFVSNGANAAQPELKLFNEGASPTCVAADQRVDVVLGLGQTINYNTMGMTFSSGIAYTLAAAATANIVIQTSLASVGAPTPAPTPTPTPSPTPTPTPTPGPASCSSSNYVNQVNGNAFTTNFCVGITGGAPWNKLLPANPQTVDSANTSRLQNNYANYTWHDFYDQGAGGYGATYFAASSDPTVSLNCSQFGCTFSVSNIHVPAKARPSSGGDGQMSVIQLSNGDQYDCWQTKQNGGSVSRDWQTGDTITCGTAGKTNATADEVIPGNSGTGYSATSGTGLPAGVVRFNEVGTGGTGAPTHALIINVGCVSGNFRYPAQSNAASCADGNGIPTGALIYLNMSDTAIDALPTSTVSTYLRPILHALHQYGGYVSDTGQVGPGTEGGSMSWVWEPGAPYNAYGTTDPGIAYGNTNGYSTSGTVRIDGGGINWSAISSSLQVLDGCYAKNNCSNP